MKFTSTALLCALFGTAAITNANHISMQPTSRNAAMEAFSSDAVRHSRSGQAKVRSYEIDLKLGGQTFQEIAKQRSMNGLLENGFETMTFELPHTQAVSFTVAKSGFANHHYVGTSTVRGSPTDAYFMVDEVTGHFAGSMSHEDGSIYSILTRPDGSTWVSFIPADERLEEEHMHMPDDVKDEYDDSRVRAERRPGDNPPVGESDYAPRDDPGVIDVMVVYTEEAMCEAAGVALSSCNQASHKSTIEGQINLAVANNNVGLANSNTGTSLNLVHQDMVDYTESGDLSTDLDRFRTDGDGHMDTVHTHRDTHKADIVALITANGSGIGYVGASKANMFSITNWGYIPGHTFAHELGHNWGCYHNRANSNTQVNYAHGYQSPDETFRTILAYNCANSYCPRVNWYSSSDTSITYQNKAIGDNVNDCARKIRERRQTVTDFYEGGNSAPAPVVPGTPAPVPAPGTCTDIAFTDSYGDNCSWYNTQDRCNTWGDCCNIGQGTAEENCCTCDGGITSGGGGGSGSGGGGSTCTDNANFVDSYGDNCSWYNTQERCITWGDCCNFGWGTANQNCCTCKGLV